ncbi:TonB-dependent receptor [Novosphingobium humi]|uniref:TonB-dependent receptor n=1 Tax=Novosphingobium humi TaxID=2282397 RepID=UPI0025B0FCE8|nr:TonB-dependent receptor [Novosphingobium humi]WJT00595.1 TonB-dependent receptor [Novosphingobium humi]
MRSVHHLPRPSQMVIAAALGLALMPAAASAEEAAAKEASADEAGTIVVRGFGQSVKNAIDIKRRAAVSLDSILASDIASFPDTNLAEAIQRVPGVAITRDAGGEGRQVSLRGFTPDYTLVRVAGMTAISTSGSIDSRGGTSNSRAFDFNLFASELFTRIDVRKSAEASVEEGGIGGTIDLHTARPLDYAKPRFALSGQGFYNSYAKDVAPRVAGLASWRNEEGTLGALVSVAYSQRNVVEKGFSTVRWATGGWNLNNVSPSVDPAITSRLNAGAANPDTLYFPRYLRYDLYAIRQKRLGVTAAFQFHPSSDLQFDLDLLYGRLRNTRDEYHLDSNSWNNSGALGRTTVSALGVTGNQITSGTFGNVWVRSDTGRYEARNDYYQAAFNAKARITDRLTADALIGYQMAQYDNQRTEIYYTRGDTTHTAGGSALSFDFSQNPNLPVLTYGFDITSPNSYIFNLLRLQTQHVLHNNAEAKLNLHFDVNDHIKLHFGGIYTRQMLNQRYYTLDVTSGVANSAPATALTTMPYNYADGLGVSGLPATWAAPDLNNARSSMNADSYALAMDQASTARIIEKVSGGYVEGDYRGSLLGHDLRGNLGLRVMHTAITSQGYIGGLWVSQGSGYTDLLPSLNAVWGLSDRFQLRLAADRNLSRPTLGNLMISGSVDANNRIIRQGNPNLKPFRADSLSLSAEYYLSARTLLAVTPFYKHIESLIISSYDYPTYASTGLPLGLLNVATTSNSPGDVFTRQWYSNGQQANVKGVELTANVGFDFLPGLLKNTGLLANYTYADGTATYTNATTGKTFMATLPQLTRHSANATIYYTDAKFDARVSVSYHGRYLTDLPAANANDLGGYNPRTQIDASLRYNITPNAAITLDAVNLNNAADSQYVGNVADNSNRVYTYLKSGRSLMVGARITM